MEIFCTTSPSTTACWVGPGSHSTLMTKRHRWLRLHRLAVLAVVHPDGPEVAIRTARVGRAFAVDYEKILYTSMTVSSGGVAKPPSIPPCMWGRRMSSRNCSQPFAWVNRSD